MLNWNRFNKPSSKNLRHTAHGQNSSCAVCVFAVCAVNWNCFANEYASGALTPPRHAPWQCLGGLCERFASAVLGIFAWNKRSTTPARENYGRH